MAANRTATYTIADDSANGLRIRPIEHVRSETRNVPPAELINPVTNLPYLAAVDQYFMNGDMVFLDAGAVTERLTAGAGPIAGFVISGGSPNGTTVIPTGQQVRIMPVVTGEVYAMNGFITSLAASKTGTNAADIVTYIGNVYNVAQVIYSNSTDSYASKCAVVDFTATSVARVMVVGVRMTPDVIDATYFCRFLVKFLPLAGSAGLGSYPGLQLDA